MIHTLFHRPAVAALRALIRSHREGFHDLDDVLSELSPEEWLTLVDAGRLLRCDACHGIDCTCPDDEPGPEGPSGPAAEVETSGANGPARP